MPPESNRQNAYRRDVAWNTRRSLHFVHLDDPASPMEGAWYHVILIESMESCTRGLAIEPVRIALGATTEIKENAG